MCTDNPCLSDYESEHEAVEAAMEAAEAKSSSSTSLDTLAAEIAERRIDFFEKSGSQAIGQLAGQIMLQGTRCDCFHTLVHGRT